MIFLGIETSCDETSIALIHHKNILKQITYMQDHNAYGGVMPQVCMREHLHHLPIVLKKLEADISLQNVDGIAVTFGPGLAGALLMGIMVAKGLALGLNKPIWPVNHLQAHALVVRMTHDITFPYLLMLISGGHCLLAIANDVDNYQILGQTRDDSVGECLDKVARALGGPYPGGRYIENQAKSGTLNKMLLPIPLQHIFGYDFSFSGLKTACIQWIARHNVISEGQRKDFCASLQWVIAQTLCQRLDYALRHTKLKQCVIAGGVASNDYFREQLGKVANAHGAQLKIPPAELCTDNGTMIAWAGYEYYRKGLPWDIDFCAQPRRSIDASYR
jgi:N6-L-threonylcarbamoyladenine synthase